MLSTGRHNILKPVLDAIGTSIILLELDKNDWKIVSFNDSFCQQFVFDPHTTAGLVLTSFLSPYIQEPLFKLLEQTITTKQTAEIEQVIDSYGKIMWYRIIAKPIMNGMVVNRILLTMIDMTTSVTLKNELDLNNKRLQSLMDNSYDGIISVDTMRNITFINKSAMKMFLIDESYIGRSLNELIPSQYHDKHDQYVSSFSESPITNRPMFRRKPVVGLRSDGVEVPIEISISKNNVGGKQELTATIRDLTEQTRLIAELSQAASLDNLTQLPNRRTINEFFTTEISRAKRYDSTFSVLILDIDSFKVVNDTHGHSCGDYVLRELSNKLTNIKRDVDLVGRWGGEEFMVILPKTDKEGAMSYGERVRSVIEHLTLEFEGVVLSITVSIGITTWEDKFDTQLGMIKRADHALYKSKSEGKNKITFV